MSPQKTLLALVHWINFLFIGISLISGRFLSRALKSTGVFFLNIKTCYYWPDAISVDAPAVPGREGGDTLCSEPHCAVKRLVEVRIKLIRSIHKTVAF